MGRTRDEILRVRETGDRPARRAIPNRLLKAHDLIASPAFIVMKAADKFKDKATAPNQLWQTDFTYRAPRPGLSGVHMTGMHVEFWKLAHWLARKYRSRIKPLMRNWYRAPEAGKAKTWLVYGRGERGDPVGKALRRMVSSPKAQFRWRNPESNPYIVRSETRSTVTSHYHDVAMAMGQA